MKRTFNSLKATMLSLGATLIFGTAYAQPCTPALANATLPAEQCLPVQLDGSASSNEDNHFIEIVEVNQVNGNTVPGTYYSSWFTGQIGNITDLGAYTGYNFQYGKRYRIKVAVQNINPANGTWCTPWNETAHMFVKIEDMATCSASSLVLHTWYDWQQDCITHFEAASNLDNSLITAVTFQLGSTSFYDNVYTYVFNMPSNAPFSGTVYATFHFADGTSYTISKQYQKCQVTTLDPNGGGPQRLAGPQDGDVKIFPNPSKGEVTIKNDFDEDAHVEIYSTQGKMIETLDMEGNTSSRLDLTSISAGIYIAKITTTSGVVEERKIVIE